jgi:hypothetical protein
MLCQSVGRSVRFTIMRRKLRPVFGRKLANANSNLWGSNLWGLPAPRCRVEQAANFAGVEVRRPAVEGEPMTAETYLAGRKPEAVAS